MKLTARGQPNMASNDIGLYRYHQKIPIFTNTDSPSLVAIYTYMRVICYFSHSNKVPLHPFQNPVIWIKIKHSFRNYVPQSLNTFPVLRLYSNLADLLFSTLALYVTSRVYVVDSDILLKTSCFFWEGGFCKRI